jgi:hypothetical protein
LTLSLQLILSGLITNLCGFYYICLALLLTVFGVESKMGDINRELVKATQKIADDLGIRFCTHCNKTRSSHNGKFRVTANGRQRWVCSNCMESGVKARNDTSRK